MTNTNTKGRRDFLKQTSIAAVGLSLLGTETALGQQATQTTFKKFVAIPLKPSALSMDGISKKTMEEHFKLYSGYVNKSNEILEALTSVDYSKANQIYSPLRELKVELSFAIGGVKSHEIYFDALGGNGGKPSGKLLSEIEKNFGSYDLWEKDFKATGLAARGWVWLAYDNDQGTLFNYLGDAQNTFPIWNAVPILALDTYEHAYFIDYAVDRKSYIKTFMRNLDWSVVEKRFNKIQK